LKTEELSTFSTASSISDPQNWKFIEWKL